MSAFAPMKTLNEESLNKGGRRFRFVPLRDRLRATSARPSGLSALPVSTPVDATDTSQTYFAEALAERRELDLTGAFCDYVVTVEPLALSLPLVVAARSRIAQETLAALVPGSPALHSIADCLYALARDIGPELFRPLLGDVAAAYARLFALDMAQDPTSAAAAEAQFWDPERALVPVFAALARISKLLAPILVRCPHETVQDLSPLLSHSHYRVRELAVEATIGYLLRKARKAPVRDGLVDAVLQLPGSVVSCSESAACDGAAAAIFEGARAIRGGLHPGALSIMTYVLDASLGRTPDSTVFEVMVRAFATLRQNTTDHDAFSSLTGALLEAILGAFKTCREENQPKSKFDGAEDTPALANASFLLCKWIEHSSSVHLSDSQQRLALEFALRVLSSPPVHERERAVCESFNVISALLRAQSHSHRARYATLNKSARHSMAAAAESVSVDLAPIAMQALRVALEARAMSVSDISSAYASLCGRLVKAGGGEEFSSISENKGSLLNDGGACEYALLFLQTVHSARNTEQCRGPIKLFAFDSPVLATYIANALETTCVDAKTKSKLLVMMKVCTYMSATGAVPGLRRFVNSWSEFEVRDSSLACLSTQALHALTCQLCLSVDGGVCQIIPEDLEALAGQASALLLAFPGDVHAVQAVTVLMSACSGPLYKGALGAINANRITAAVASNLASAVVQERIATARLLLAFATCDVNGSRMKTLEADPLGQPICSLFNGAIGLRGCVEDSSQLGDLLKRLDICTDSSAVCEGILYIMTLERTITSAVASQQVSSSLARVLKRKSWPGGLENLFVILSNTAIGMFRTRFKPLWKAANELWSAVAALSPDTAWVPLRFALQTSKLGIVTSCRKSPPVEDGFEESMVAVDENLWEVGGDTKLPSLQLPGSPQQGSDSKDANEGNEYQERSSREERPIGNSEQSDRKTGLSAVKLQRKRPRSAQVKGPDVGSRDLAGESGCEQFPLSTSRMYSSSDPLKTLKASHAGERFPKRQRFNRGPPGRLVSSDWNSASWQVGLESARESAISTAVSLVFLHEVSPDSTDALTLHLELLFVVGSNIKSSLDERCFLVRELYLQLKPEYMSRRMGSSVATAYSTLLEKLGGLKATGDDRELEVQMRSRLMDSLCIPDSVCQSAAIKCLSVARSPEIRKHRNSLLRLADDSTFRDELSALTAELRGGEDVSTVEGSIASKDLEDVLVRICFGKMKGRRDRLGSRRGAALSFIASALSWSDAIPRLIQLALAPIQNESGYCNGESTSQAANENRVGPDAGTGASCELGNSFLSLNVCRGMLHSIDSIVEQFGAAIPSGSWRDVTCAVSHIVKSTCLSTAKTVRSMALRRLATMLERRPGDTEFIVLDVVASIRASRFDTSSATDVTKAPGLLLLLASCATCELPSVHKGLLRQEKWTQSWIADIVESGRAHPKSVLLALTIAKRFASYAPVELDQGPCGPSTGIESTTRLVSAVECRLALLRAQQTSGNRSAGWRDVLSETMNVVGVLAVRGIARKNSMLIAESLMTLVTSEAGRSPEVVHASLSALAKLYEALCSEDVSRSGQALTAEERGPYIDSTAFFLGRLFNDKIVAGEEFARAALCTALSSLTRPDMVVASSILSALGAMRKDRVSEADYDVRLRTLSSLSKLVSKETSADSCVVSLSKEDVIETTAVCLEGTSSESAVSLEGPSTSCVLYGLLWTLKDTDSAARGTAGYALCMLAKRVASRRHVLSQLFNEMQSGLVSAVVSAHDLSERREACGALGELVRSSLGTELCEGTSEDSHQALLRCLQSLARPDDLEVDFFENVAHLQPHRRSRALRRLSAILDAKSDNQKSAEVGNISSMDANAAGDLLRDPESKLRAEESFFLAFAMPLSFRIALDVADAPSPKSNHSRAKEARLAASSDVSRWACACVASTLKCVPRKNYCATFGGLLRRIPREQNEYKRRVLYEILVATADAFPCVDLSRQANKDLSAFLSKNALPHMLKQVTAGALEGDVLSSVMAGHTKRGKGGSSDTGAISRTAMTFRSSVAIAAAKLLRRLPENEMESSLPLLVTPVASALRSRMSEAREGAKKALVHIVILFEGRFLPYIVDQVLSVLAQGYRKDAIVFVLHSLLQGIQVERKRKLIDGNGSFLSVDSAAKSIADALTTELVEGAIHNSKDFCNPNVSGSRGKDSALRATRAYDAFEILGELISFKDTATAVFEPLRIAVVQATGGRICSRLETAFQRLVLGFVRNKSLTAYDSLLFVHEVIHDFMPVTTEEDEVNMSNEPRPHGQHPRAHVVVEFGLQFLNSLLAKSVVKVDGTSEHEKELRRMLEPFLPELGLALKSRFDSLTLISLKVTQRLVRLPLLGRELVAEDMVSTVLEVLSRGGVQGGQCLAKNVKCQDLFQTCLRVASTIIYETSSDGRKTIREDIVRQLVVIVRQCLDQGSADMRNSALAFIRTVVSAKFKVPEVYDAVDDVSKLAVQGQSTSLQSSCIAISVAFLVNFPLTAKRIRQQLDFYVRNLSYEHATGRIAAIQALATVISKFPSGSLDAECESIFLPLTAVVANDGDEKCRLCAAQALESLFVRVSDGRRLSDLLSMSKSLLGTEECANHEENRGVTFMGHKVVKESESSLQKAGACALGSAASSGALQPPQLESILNVTLALAALGCLGKTDLDWDVTHACLCAAERALEALSGSEDRSSGEGAVECVAACNPKLRDFWCNITLFLRHEHLWVRVAVCRLLGRHFAATEVASASKPQTNETLFSILNAPTGTIRDVVKELCLVLEGTAMSGELAEQALKNLLYLANAMRRDPNLGDANGEEDGDDAPLEVARDGENTVAGTEDGNRGLFWLLRRISGMATRGGQEDSGLLRRACAMRFLAAAAASWPAESVQPYVGLFIGPTLRVLESKVPLKGKSDMGEAAAGAIPEMAHAVQDVLVRQLGGDAYYAVYNELRVQRKTHVEERKRRLAVEAATDPEKAARKRLRRSAAKARARKSSAGARHAKSWRVSKASFQVDDGNAGSLAD